MAAFVAISFDDGRKDNLAVIQELLLPHNIPVTLYVTTGFIDGTCPRDKLPTYKKAMCIDDVVWLSQQPNVEIGLHGDMHMNEEWDIKNGRDKVVCWTGYPMSHKFGFASPSTQFSIHQFACSDSTFLTREISYLAMGLRIKTLSVIRKLARKAGRVIHLPTLFRIAYSDTIMLHCPDRIVYRVPIHSDITFEQVKAVVDATVNRSASVVFMFHSIEQNSDDTWTWKKDRFNKFCTYLTYLRDCGQVKLVSVQDLVRHLQNKR